MKKIYTYFSKLSADEFNTKVKELVTKNHREAGELMYDTLKGGFALGVGRGGHGGGYWYDAKLSEEDDILKIEGSINYHNLFHEKRKGETLGLILICIGFFIF